MSGCGNCASLDSTDIESLIRLEQVLKLGSVPREIRSFSVDGGEGVLNLGYPCTDGYGRARAFLEVLGARHVICVDMGL